VTLAFAADTQPATRPALDGVWRGFTVEGKGERPDRGPVQLELTIKGDHITARRLDGNKEGLGEGDYRITPGQPATMDATEVRARGRARTYLGILSQEGDTLRWCVATPNNPRPTEFETKRPNFLLVLRRQKE